jgi:hypothetical protein
MRTIRPMLYILIGSLMVAGCVRQEDLDSWVGAPVSALDTHPVFVSMPVVRTVAADGTEIRNYTNFVEGGGGARCNNIFYIKNGRVVKYTPVGTGARCRTDQTLQPGFSGPTNYQ